MSAGRHRLGEGGKEDNGEYRATTRLLDYEQRSVDDGDRASDEGSIQKQGEREKWNIKHVQKEVHQTKLGQWRMTKAGASNKASAPPLAKEASSKQLPSGSISYLLP